VAYVNVGTRTNSGGNTSATPALPASRVSGNILIAICGTKNNATHSTATSGWDKIDQVDSGTGWTLSLFWRVIDGSEAAPVITWSGSVANFAIITQISEASPTNPIGAILGNPNSGTPHTNAGITGTGLNSQVFYIGGAAANTAYGTTSGWTERSDAGSNTGATRHVIGNRNSRINTGDSSGSTSNTGAAAVGVMYQLELLSPVFSVSGTPTDLGDTASGDLTFSDGSRSISGSITDLGDTSSGTIENSDPVYAISGSVTDLGDTASGTLTFGAAVYSISGTPTDLGDTASGTIENTDPIYSISGSVTDLGDFSSGTIENIDSVYSVSGNVTDLGDTSSGTIENIDPIYSISGNVTDLGDSSSGSITFELQVYSLSGNVTDLGDTASGTITFTATVFSLSGNVTDLGDTASGTIENIDPVYSISGSINDLGDICGGSIMNTPPLQAKTYINGTFVSGTIRVYYNGGWRNVRLRKRKSNSWQNVT